jgi:hypothetical protein
MALRMEAGPNLGVANNLEGSALRSKWPTPVKRKGAAAAFLRMWGWRDFLSGRLWRRSDCAAPLFVVEPAWEYLTGRICGGFGPI